MTQRQIKNSVKRGVVDNKSCGAKLVTALLERGERNVFFDDVRKKAIVIDVCRTH